MAGPEELFPVYSYEPLYPPAPLVHAHPTPSSPLRPESPLDLLHDLRPTFPVLRDLTDQELLVLTDLHLFYRQRQHVETLRDKTRYVDRLMRFLELEGKFSTSDLFARGPPPAEDAATVPPPSQSRRAGLDGYVGPPSLSPGMYPQAGSSMISFYQPLYTPHSAGGVKSPSGPSEPRAPMKQSSQKHGRKAEQGGPDECEEGGKEGKGKGKAIPETTARNKKKKGVRPPDQGLEKRWASYYQTRFRYQWETEHIDAEIRVLEAAVDRVIVRTSEEIVTGGGLKRDTLNDIARLRELHAFVGRGGREKKEAALAPVEGTREINQQGLITQLPTEILHQVFSYFRPPQLASTLSLVCRRWHAIATPIVYRKVSFGDYTEDYWVEVSRRKRAWERQQAMNANMEKADSMKHGGRLRQLYQALYPEDYFHPSPVASGIRPPPPGLLLSALSDAEGEEEDEPGRRDQGEEQFFPDGKQATMFPIGGPALVVMPWSIGIIKAIGNPHLAKHVRHIDYQGSSYNSFPNHNEAGKVFTDPTDPRAMLDQRYRSLSKLLQLVKRAVRHCTRVEILELNSGDERISNALLGILKWSPRLKRLTIGNTNLGTLQFSRGIGKGIDKLIDRDTKGKARARSSTEYENPLPHPNGMFGTNNSGWVSRPQKTGLKVRIKSGVLGEEFNYPSLKCVTFYRCGYAYLPQRAPTRDQAVIRRGARGHPGGNATERQRRRRKRMRVRLRVANGEKRALEKVVLFLQRCNNLEELQVKACQFLPEALVDSKLCFAHSTERPLTLPNLERVTIRSCGMYITDDGAVDAWLACPAFEAFFLRHNTIKHLGWTGWILDRNLPLDNSAFGRVARQLGRTLTSLSIAHGFDEEVARTAPESLHRVRLSIRRFNFFIRQLPLLESLDWRMYLLPIDKLMMAIRNLRHCPLLRNIRIDGVMGIISQDEAREITTSVPLLQKLRINWRPRPCGYRRGRSRDEGAPPPLSLSTHPTMWFSDTNGNGPLGYDASSFPTVMPNPPEPPPLPPLPPFLPLPTSPPDSDIEDADWAGESPMEPEWNSPQELSSIFSHCPFLKDLFINVTFTTPGMARVTRHGLLSKVRATAMAFAHSPAVRRIGVGYFSDTEGLRVTVTLRRGHGGKVVGWHAYVGDDHVSENWGADPPPLDPDNWIDGVIKAEPEGWVRGGGGWRRLDNH